MIRMSSMLNKIQAVLSKTPALKAKTIAAQLHADKAQVNKLLHDHQDIFVKDQEAFTWSLVSQAELRIELGDHRWLSAEHFENALVATTSPLDSKCRSVIFVVAKDCKILLEALARLLALCNQLADAGKEVSIDFSAAKPTLNYLNRIGFFDLLRQGIKILPRRPRVSAAIAYDGNNYGVVELREIDHIAPNDEIPDLLRNSFVSCAGDQYSVAAFTVLSELFGNVQEHSASTTAGFAALQYYKAANHIQTVISDSGLGIVGTLMPVLKDRYPEVVQRIAESSLEPGVVLLQEVFSGGGISKVNDPSRGLGLKRSGELANKFNAIISVRQENFEFKVRRNRRGIEFSHTLGLARISGTHICFDFLLDPPSVSR